MLEARDLETVLASSAIRLGKIVKKEPFEFKSKSQLIEYLELLDYEIKENASVKNRSGAVHNIEIMASKDDDIINHRITISIEMVLASYSP